MNVFKEVFHGVNRIDEDFRPGLEKLLEGHIPYYEYLVKGEEKLPEDTAIEYHIFFRANSNEVIGLICIQTKIISRNTLYFKKSQKTHLRWQIPSLDEGVIFKPTSKKEMRFAVEDVFKAIKDKNPDSQEIFISQENEVLSKIADLSNAKIVSFHKPAPVVSHQSYESFLNTLSNEEKVEIEKEWKQLYKDFNFSIGTYDKFKEIFQYKDYGPHIYKELKNLNNYSNQSQFITLENEYDLFAVLMVWKTESKSFFFEILYHDPCISKEICFHLACIHFFEDKEQNRLINLHQNQMTGPKQLFHRFEI